MSFSEKAKHYFHKELKLDNREIAKRMNNYSESLVSRFLNQDKISATFVLKIKKYFPEAPVDDWTKGNGVEEPKTVYTIDPVKRINRIMKELEELKQELSQK